MVGKLRAVMSINFVLKSRFSSPKSVTRTVMCHMASSLVVGMRPPCFCADGPQHKNKVALRLEFHCETCYMFTMAYVNMYSEVSP